jgi:hypothetical protein
MPSHPLFYMVQHSRWWAADISIRTDSGADLLPPVVAAPADRQGKAEQHGLHTSRCVVDRKKEGGNTVIKKQALCQERP